MDTKTRPVYMLPTKTYFRTKDTHRLKVHCWWECKLVHPLWKTVEIPQRTKNRTTIQSSNSTAGYMFEENKNPNSKRYMHPYVHCSIIYNSQDMEAT